MISKHWLKSSTVIFLITISIIVHGQTGPGGVGNSTSNKIWLKADAGIIDATANARVPLWADQSGNGFNANQGAGSRRPTYQLAGPNGHPFIHFDRTVSPQYLDLFSAGMVSLSTNSNTMFVVGKANTGGADNSTNAAQGLLVIPYLEYHSGIAISGYPDATSTVIEHWLGVWHNGRPTRSISVSSSINQGSWNLFSSKITEISGGTSMVGFLNGSAIGSVSDVLPMTNYNSPSFRIGAALPSGNNSWGLNGDIAEVIVYNMPLNEAERILVENYLSSKYQQSIVNDKFAYDTPNGYYHDVAGIGRENNTNINSTATSNLINVSGASSLDDGDYVLLGHNGQSLVPSNDDAPAGMKRLNRIWRADLSGDPGTLSISFKVAHVALPPGQAFRLLVDDDGQFANATQYEGTLTGEVFTVASPVALPDGTYLTLAYTSNGSSAPVSLAYNPNKTILTYGDLVNTSQPLIADGGAIPTYSLVNPPQGVSINTVSGILTLDHTPVGTYSLNVSVSNLYGTSIFNNAYIITVYPYVASKFEYAVETVSDGNTIDPLLSNLPPNAFQYSVESGSLNGLMLNISTGEISGKLQSAGTTSAIIKATPQAPNAVGNAITAPVIVSAVGASGPGGVGSLLHNKIWLDADYQTGLSNGASLTTFQDRSGNGWNAVQTTTSRKPKYYLNQVNGKAVVRLDRNASLQCMDITSPGAGVLMSNSNTILIVAKANAGAIGSSIPLQSLVIAPGFHSGMCFLGYPTTDRAYFQNYVGGIVYGETPGSNVQTSGALVQGAWQIISRNIIGNKTTTQIGFINGIQMGDPAKSNLPMTKYTTDLIRIGAGTLTGTQSLPLHGDIAEMIFYNTSLNSAQRIIVENYIAAKYNLTISNDKYSLNDLAYTLDVEGIGTTDGTRANKHSIASNGKGLKLEEANTSLNQAGEFLFAGHASTSNALVNTDLPATVSDRWERTWFVEKTGTVDVKLSFDLSEGGVTASADLLNEVDYYKLLFRSTSSGSFTVVPVNALLTNDDQLSFTLSDSQLTNGYYTLGNSQGLVWTGAQDRDWNKPGNWSLNRVPNLNDKVVINVCTTCPVLRATVNVAGLRLNSGKINIGSHELVVSGETSMNNARVESDQGKIRSADFTEVKNSVFQGSVVLQKSGGISNTWYGGNTFSSELKLVNASATSLHVASHANNIVQDQ